MTKLAFKLAYWKGVLSVSFWDACGSLLILENVLSHSVVCPSLETSIFGFLFAQASPKRRKKDFCVRTFLKRSWKKDSSRRTNLITSKLVSHKIYSSKKVNSHPGNIQSRESFHFLCVFQRIFSGDDFEVFAGKIPESHKPFFMRMSSHIWWHCKDIHPYS